MTSTSRGVCTGLDTKDHTVRRVMLSYKRGVPNYRWGVCLMCAKRAKMGRGSKDVFGEATQVGDIVYIKNFRGNGPPIIAARIQRVSKTRIMVVGGRSFLRSNGREVGGDTWYGSHALPESLERAHEYEVCIRRVFYLYVVEALKFLLCTRPQEDWAQDALHLLEKMKCREDVIQSVREQWDLIQALRDTGRFPPDLYPGSLPRLTVSDGGP